ncbi:hypothetical protein [Halobacillus kuroshimensis]|uniref:hypothetical protein n=1 Tax=Halobacillus kuroshimensis TaxID=302481 RepID=UPI00040917AF|nr:hypothetical protein [Halobacillus kuroshimensis]
MQLDFEKWFYGKNFPREAINQFKESVICFKASAYRASLLMSYLGFQLVLKERILTAEKPDNIEREQSWEAIKKNLRKEDKWDEEVNECIKKSDDKKRIFIISEDLRNQAKYWKYRRNDCAHSKPNQIDASHVESFWLFLRSNIDKFVVGGSMEALLTRIDKHFDSNFTSNTASHSILVEEIPKTILEEDIEKFYMELTNIFESHFIYPLVAQRALEFWNELIRLEGAVGQKAIEFIKHESLLEIEFLSEYPERTAVFYECDSPEVRNLWRSKIHRGNYVLLNIFISLCRNGLIKKEKEEALEYLVVNIKQTSLLEEWISPLKEIGFFKKYKDLVFANEGPLLNQFDWGNNSYWGIGDFLDQIGLDSQVVLVINNTFSTTYYPFKMQKAIKEYFDRKEGEKEDYKNICEQLSIEPAENLGF